MYPFSPSGDSINLAVTGTSSRVTLPAGAPSSIRVSNPGGVTVYVRFGDSVVAAQASTGMDLLPGTVETFRVPVGTTHLAAITDGGVTTLRITPGQGL